MTIAPRSHGLALPRKAICLELYLGDDGGGDGLLLDSPPGRHGGGFSSLPSEEAGMSTRRLRPGRLKYQRATGSPVRWRWVADLAATTRRAAVDAVQQKVMQLLEELAAGRWWRKLSAAHELKGRPAEPGGIEASSEVVAKAVSVIVDAGKAAGRSRNGRRYRRYICSMDVEDVAARRSGSSQAGGGEDGGFVDGEEFLAAFFGGFEADFEDAGDFGFGVGQGVHGLAVGGLAGDPWGWP